MIELRIPTKKTNTIHNEVPENTTFLLLDQPSGEANTTGTLINKIDEIECNRDKQKTGGTGYLLLTVKANPTLSFRIQEFGMNQTSPSRIRTYDQSVNSRPLYH